MRMTHGADFRSFEKLDRELAILSQSKVRIGVLAEEGTTANLATILEYAIYNEYGSPKTNLPSRPFFRSATEWGKSKKEIDLYAKAKVNKVISTFGEYSANKALGAMASMLGEEL